MSQRNVEILLGKILTDESFRRAFFPVRPSSFDAAAALGLQLTSIERNALSTLKVRRFNFIAQTLDPRISRLCECAREDAEAEAPAGARKWEVS